MAMHPIQPGRIHTQWVEAVIRRGSWIVECPFCLGTEYADQQELLFICCSCWNEAVEGKPLPVRFPAPTETAAIETILAQRPSAHHWHWTPGMTEHDMVFDYVRRQKHGTPTDQTTGDLITAAIYNARIGTTGDLAHMWIDHDHGTNPGAGDGAAILGEEDNTAGAVAVAEGAWTTLGTVGFTPLADDVILLLAELQTVTINEGGAAWAEAGIRITRTAGAGGTIIGCNTTVVRQGNNTMFRHNCVGLFKPDVTGTGAQTFEVQGWQDTDVGGAADNMTATITAIRLGKGEIAF